VIERIWGATVAVLFGSVVVLSFLNYEIPTALGWSLALVFVGGALAFIFTRGMSAFVVRRLWEALLTIWVIATCTFLLLRVVPGGPFDSEKALPPEIMANLAAKYHLDKPLLGQYLDYMRDLVHGDLGQSYKYLNRGITDILLESLPASVQLGVYALLIAYMIGIPTGIIAGWKANTRTDFTCMLVAVSGVALPSFLVASILILVFVTHLHWFEPALWEGPAYYTLPMIILGLRPAAMIARLTRASVLEVVHSDFIRTARAKGLSQSKILFKHILRNSLIPVLTLSGPLIAGILTGSFVIEQIFAIPGISKHTILGVTNRDYPLILGTTLVFSCLLVVANLVTDLLIAVIDPRVKIS
jgi:oligopeptide transport system permease protein